MAYKKAPTQGLIDKRSREKKAREEREARWDELLLPYDSHLHQSMIDMIRRHIKESGLGTIMDVQTKAIKPIAKQAAKLYEQQQKQQQNVQSSDTPEEGTGNSSDSADQGSKDGQDN